MSKGWWWVAAGAVIVAAWAARGGDSSDSTADLPKPAVQPQVSVTPSIPKPSPEADWFENYDPAQFAGQVRRSAGRAGISPQLLMAILYNEDYKPHNPQLERSWQHIKPDAAFGIANMHRAAFDEAKRGRSFARRSWDELPDHPELAIEAAAWHLHDLAARLPRGTGKFRKDELLALGYNAGARNMRAFANGAKPGSQAQSYLDNLHQNWAKSATALSRSW
ncbi:transglycosylase SLT domain-containing protein [Kribbella sp. NPDC006257]|uniref:transglycosylase SLT domain-containing protein n=1 Tax=Kribbella sp. NPDC006257 TaxID=3156738 RepID=UPI0033A24514